MADPIRVEVEFEAEVGEGVLAEASEEAKRQILEVVIEACDHNKSEAARVLGLSRYGLVRALDRLGIDRGES